MNPDDLTLLCRHWQERLETNEAGAVARVRDQLKALADSPESLADLAARILEEDEQRDRLQRRLERRHWFKEGETVLFARSTKAHNDGLRCLLDRPAKVERCIPNDALWESESAPAYVLNFGWEALYLSGQQYWSVAEKWLNKAEPGALPPQVFLAKTWPDADPWGDPPKLTPEQVERIVSNNRLQERPRMRWVQNEIPCDDAGRLKVKRLPSNRAFYAKGTYWPLLVQLSVNSVGTA